MLHNKWLNSTFFYAPEGVDAGGTQTPEGGTTPPPVDRGSDGPGSGRSTLRKQLEGAFEDERKRETRDDRGRFRPKQQEETQEGSEQKTEEVEVKPEGGEQQEETQVTKVAPPDGFSKEAKAEWEKTPPQVQTAILKREQDMNKGVEELKKKYNEIDQALNARMDVIRKSGHTPAQAVNQLFAWFEAINSNPKIAIPALLESFKLDPKIIFPNLAQAAQPAPAPADKKEGTEQPAGEVPPQVQQYINGMEQKIQQLGQAVVQRFGQLEGTFQQQNQAKTQEILDTWAKGKPHFEEVRQMMAHFIGSGAIPPLPNGAADLDTAYDRAIWAMPEIREKILAEQQQKADTERKEKEAKEKKAQQEAADKARRTAGSLSLSAPGAPVDDKKGAKKGNKSVRESLSEAIKQVNDKRI